MPSLDSGANPIADDYPVSPHLTAKPTTEEAPAKVGIPDDFVPCINEEQFARLLMEGKRKPLPAADTVFPWLHGICPNNVTFSYLQRDEKSKLTTPEHSAGLMLVSASNFWESTSLRGTVHISDILETTSDGSEYAGQFINRDDSTTVNVRNFEIQCSKFAQICDIIIYVPGLYDEGGTAESVADAFHIAKLVRRAQRRINSSRITLFFPNTLFDLAMKLGVSMSSSILLPPVADAPLKGDNCWDYNLHFLEYYTLVQMSKAVPIQPNIWVGSSMDIRREDLPDENDPSINSSPVLRRMYELTTKTPADGVTKSRRPWTMVVQCLFACSTLPTLSELDHAIRSSSRLDDDHTPIEFVFPGTSAFVGSNLEPKHIAQIVNLCHLIHVRSQRGNVLLASEDGHRASSLLVLIYLIYYNASTVEDAVLYLHSDLGRSFSVGGEDMKLLKSLQDVLREMSPKRGYYKHTRGAIPVSRIPSVTQVLARHRPKSPEPQWALESHGSFPSRILPHLYLGSYAQASNVEMLKALGIRRLVSLGECPLSLELKEDGQFHHNEDFELVLKVPELRDNGLDSIKPYLEPCLRLLADSEEKGIMTLVHCQQGVSRSAAVCIAEVMRSTSMCLPEAYIWTRVHRMDVIIQPNLRLMYDLLKYEEETTSGRSIEWPVLCREVASLNREYL